MLTPHKFIDALCIKSRQETPAIEQTVPSAALLYIVFSKRVFSKSVNGFTMVLTESVNGGLIMNERFFALPKEKQQAIINAGYRVFSQNSYKNSPMSEIADAAGISKSLLFHYFRNKKELYMFLWDKCAEITIEYLKRYN